MAEINWDALTLDELKEIKRRVDKAIESVETRRKQDALAVLDRMASEMGFTLKDLAGSPASSSPKLPPKYAHPDDPLKTWSGRGRRPQWVLDQVAAGKALDELLI